MGELWHQNMRATADGHHLGRIGSRLKAATLWSNEGEGALDFELDLNFTIVVLLELPVHVTPQGNLVPPQPRKELTPSLQMSFGALD